MTRSFCYGLLDAEEPALVDDLIEQSGIPTRRVLSALTSAGGGRFDPAAQRKTLYPHREFERNKCAPWWGELEVNMAKQSLVIVESPAKAKTIGKYLGKDFEVKACMGHLRDLPKSKTGRGCGERFRAGL